MARILNRERIKNYNCFQESSEDFDCGVDHLLLDNASEKDECRNVNRNRCDDSRDNTESYKDKTSLPNINENNSRCLQPELPSKFFPCNCLGIPVSPSRYCMEMMMSSEERYIQLRELSKLNKSMSVVNEKCVVHDSRLWPVMAVPNQICFQNCEPLGKYSATVTLHNYDSAAHNVTLIYGESPYFKIGAWSQRKKRLLPGLSVTFKILFCPELRKDYSYEIQYCVDGCLYDIPVKALGPRAVLDFPDVIQFPMTPVKCCNEKSLTIGNIGRGKAVFTLLTNPPFSVEPLQGSVEAGCSVLVKVGFNALCAGTHQDILNLHYDTGEDVSINLIGCARNESICLSNSSILFEDTYLTMTTRKNVKLVNNSSMVIQYSWKSMATVALEEQYKTLMAERIVEETFSDRYKNCDFEKTFLNRARKNCTRAYSENGFPFSDDSFSIDELEGEVWPGGFVELEVAFHPQRYGLQDTVAFCEVTGRDLRLPLSLHGTALPPCLTASLDTLDVGAVFIGSVHSYQITLANKGLLDAKFHIESPDGDMSRSFSIKPCTGCVTAGGYQLLIITFNPSIPCEFTHNFHVCVEENPNKISIQIRGVVLPPSLEFNVPYLNFETVSYGFTETLQCYLSNKSIVPVNYTARIESCPACVTSNNENREITCDVTEACMSNMCNNNTCDTDSSKQICVSNTSNHNTCDSNVVSVCNTSNNNTCDNDSSDQISLYNDHEAHPVLSCKRSCDDLQRVWSVEPARGCLSALECRVLSVSVCANCPQQYRARLVIDVDNLAQDYINIPLFACCPVPQILLLNSHIDIGRTFLRHPSCTRLVLCNDTSSKITYSVSSQDSTAEEEGLRYEVIEPQGVIAEHCRIEVELRLVPEALGEIKASGFVHVFGNPTPAEFDVYCISQGPVVVVEPHCLDWGEICVLGDHNNHLILTNESPIGANVTASLRYPDCGWKLCQTCCFVPPQDSCRLPMTAFFTDPIRRAVALKLHKYKNSQTNSLNVHTSFGAERMRNIVDLYVEHGACFSIPVYGCGCGVSITICPPLPECIDLGCALIGQKLRCDFVMTNQSARVQRVRWETMGYPSHAQKLRMMQKTKDASRIIPVPVFHISGSLVDLCAGQSSQVTLEGTLCRACCVEECVRVVTTYKYEDSLVGSLMLKCRFVEPDFNISTDQLSYSVLASPGEPLQCECKSFSISNTCELPVHVCCAVEQPFQFISSNGELSSCKELELCGCGCVEMMVQYNPVWSCDPDVDVERDKISRSSEGCVTVRCVEKQDKVLSVKLYGEVLFPNLCFDATELDFGCIVNDSDATRCIVMKNISPFCIHYSWTFPQDCDSRQYTCFSNHNWKSSQDGAMFAESLNFLERRHLYRLEEIFNMMPMFGTLAPDDSETLIFTFHGHSFIRSGTVLQCHVQNGPTYEMCVYGQADEVLYSLSDTDIDMGIVMYNCVAQSELTLRNIGLVGFEFSVSTNSNVCDQENNSDFFLPDVPHVTPQSGRLESCRETTLTIQFSPLSVHRFSSCFTLTVSHLEPVVVSLRGGVDVPRVVLSLPRCVDSKGRYQRLRDLAQHVIAYCPPPEPAEPDDEDFTAENIEEETQQGEECENCGDTEEQVIEDCHPELETHTTSVKAEETVTSKTSDTKESAGEKKKGKEEKVKGKGKSKNNNKNNSSCECPCVQWQDPRCDEDLIELNVDLLAVEEFIYKYHNIPWPRILEQTDNECTSKQLKLRLPGYVLEFGRSVWSMTHTREVSLGNTSCQDVSIIINQKQAQCKGFCITPPFVEAIEPGSTTVLCVTFNAQSVNLCLEPVSCCVLFKLCPGPEIAVQLTADVMVPRLCCSAGCLDFGTVKVGECRVYTVQISNPDNCIMCEWKAKPAKCVPVCDREVFTVLPCSGCLSCGEKKNIHVIFTPKEETSYCYPLEVHIKYNCTPVLINCRGCALQPRIEVMDCLVTFDPTLPYISASKTLTLWNPCSFPVEVYSLEYDVQHVEEDEMLRLVFGGDVEGRGYLPQRCPGQSLPPEIIDCYDEHLFVQQKVECCLAELEAKSQNQTAEDDLLKTTAETSEQATVAAETSTTQVSSVVSKDKDKSGKETRKGHHQGKKAAEVEVETPVETEQDKQGDKQVEREIDMICGSDTACDRCGIPPELCCDIPSVFSLPSLDLTPLSCALARHIGINTSRCASLARILRGISIIVHGAPKSGKSYTSRMFGREYSAAIVNIDDLIIQEIRYNTSLAGQRARQICIEAEKARVALEAERLEAERLAAEPAGSGGKGKKDKNKKGDKASSPDGKKGKEDKDKDKGKGGKKKGGEVADQGPPSLTPEADQIFRELEDKPSLFGPYRQPMGVRFLISDRLEDCHPTPDPSTLPSEAREEEAANKGGKAEKGGKPKKADKQADKKAKEDMKGKDKKKGKKDRAESPPPVEEKPAEPEETCCYGYTTVLPSDIIIDILAARVLQADTWLGVVFDGLDSSFTENCVQTLHMVLTALSNRCNIFFVDLKYSYEAILCARSRIQAELDQRELDGEMRERCCLYSLLEDDYDCLTPAQKHWADCTQLHINKERFLLSLYKDQRNTELLEAAALEKAQEAAAAEKRPGDKKKPGDKSESAGSPKKEEKQPDKKDAKKKQKAEVDTGTDETPPIEPEELHLIRGFQTYEVFRKDLKTLLTYWNRNTHTVDLPVVEEVIPDKKDKKRNKKSDKEEKQKGKKEKNKSKNANTNENAKHDQAKAEKPKPDKTKADKTKADKSKKDKKGKSESPTMVEEEVIEPPDFDCNIRMTAEGIGVTAMTLNMCCLNADYIDLYEIISEQLCLPLPKHILESLGLGDTGPIIPPPVTLIPIEYPCLRPKLPDVHFLISDACLVDDDESSSGLQPVMSQNIDESLSAEKQQQTDVELSTHNAENTQSADPTDSDIKLGSKKSSFESIKSGTCERCYRWVIPAKAKLRVSLCFQSTELGQFDEMLHFQLLGAPTMYQAHCRACCAYPTLNPDPSVIFNHRITSIMPCVTVSNVYIYSDKIFDFGPLAIGRSKEKHADQFSQCFYLSNISPFTADVGISFYFDNKEENYIVKPSCLTLEPCKGEYVHVWSYPTVEGVVRDRLVCSIENNPEPFIINVTSTGVKLHLDLDINVIEFGRVLIEKTEMREIRMTNEGLIPVAWHIDTTSLEPYKDSLSISQQSGIVLPQSCFELLVFFRSDQPLVVPTTRINLEICDVDFLTEPTHLTEITMSAEAYQVLVEVEYPKGMEDVVDFKEVRMYQENKQIITLKNSGKYDVNFLFMFDSPHLCDGCLAQILSIKPLDGLLGGGGKTLPVTLTLNSDRMLHVDKLPLLRCQVFRVPQATSAPVVVEKKKGEKANKNANAKPPANEGGGKQKKGKEPVKQSERPACVEPEEPSATYDDLDLVESLPINLSFTSCMSRYEVAPRILNFGIVPVGSTIPLTIKISNVRKPFDFSYEITRRMTEEMRQQEEAEASKGKGKKDKKDKKDKKEQKGKKNASNNATSPKKEKKSKDDKGKKKEGLGGTGSLVAGAFNVFPITGNIQPENSVIINVEFNGSTAGIFNEILLVDISGRDELDFPLGIDCRLCGEMVVPGFNTENLCEIFEEQRICCNMDAWKCLQDRITCGVYLIEENTFSFNEFMYGTRVKARFKLINDRTVPCTVALSAGNRAVDLTSTPSSGKKSSEGSKRSSEGKKKTDVKSVSTPTTGTGTSAEERKTDEPKDETGFSVEPWSVDIPLCSYTYVTLTLNPNNLEIFESTFTAVSKTLVPNGEISTLSFKIVGQASLPMVSLIKPSMNPEQRTASIRFRPCVVEEVLQTEFTVRNDSLLSCNILIDLKDECCVFCVKPVQQQSECSPTCASLCRSMHVASCLLHSEQEQSFQVSYISNHCGKFSGSIRVVVVENRAADIVIQLSGESYVDVDNDVTITAPSYKPGPVLEGVAAEKQEESEVKPNKTEPGNETKLERIEEEGEGEGEGLEVKESLESQESKLNKHVDKQGNCNAVPCILSLGECFIGECKQDQLIITNRSPTFLYRYEWPCDDPLISFSPRVGHLPPCYQQCVCVTFRGDAAMKYEGRFGCKLSQICLLEVGAMCGWNTSTVEVGWCDVIQEICDVSAANSQSRDPQKSSLSPEQKPINAVKTSKNNNAKADKKEKAEPAKSTPAKQKKGSPNITPTADKPPTEETDHLKECMKDKVCNKSFTRTKYKREMPEPCRCVVEGSERELYVTVLATVDYCQYMFIPTLLPDQCLTFCPTNVFQRTTLRLTLTNLSSVRMPFDWSVALSCATPYCCSCGELVTPPHCTAPGCPCSEEEPFKDVDMLCRVCCRLDCGYYNPFSVVPDCGVIPAGGQCVICIIFSPLEGGVHASVLTCRIPNVRDAGQMLSVVDAERKSVKSSESDEDDEDLSSEEEQEHVTREQQVTHSAGKQKQKNNNARKQRVNNRGEEESVMSESRTETELSGEGEGSVSLTNSEPHEKQQEEEKSPDKEQKLENWSAVEVEIKVDVRGCGVVSCCYFDLEELNVCYSGRCEEEEEPAPVEEVPEVIKEPEPTKTKQKGKSNVNQNQKKSDKPEKPGKAEKKKGKDDKKKGKDEKKVVQNAEGKADGSADDCCAEVCEMTPVEPPPPPKPPALPPDTRVVEFDICGIRRCCTRCFDVISVECQRLCFKWIKHEYYKNDVLFICHTTKGVIEAGKKTQMSFTARSPDCVGRFESLWYFDVPSQGVCLPVLLVMYVREPRVWFDRAHLYFGTVIACQGMRAKQTVNLVNTECMALQFKILESSLTSTDCTTRLDIQPRAGTLCPNSCACLELTFITLKDGEVTFNVCCDVEGMCCPVKLNVKANAYIPAANVYHVERLEDGTEKVEEFSYSCVNTLRFVRIGMSCSSVRTVRVLNVGCFMLTFCWSVSAGPGSCCCLCVEPQTSSIKPGEMSDCLVTWTPQRRVNLSKCCLTLHIEHGRQYVIQPFSFDTGESLNLLCCPAEEISCREILERIKQKESPDKTPEKPGKKGKNAKESGGKKEKKEKKGKK